MCNWMGGNGGWSYSSMGSGQTVGGAGANAATALRNFGGSAGKGSYNDLTCSDTIHFTGQSGAAYISW